MTVLVTAASRHGATTEIAERIAETLRSRGLLVVELPPEDVLSLSGLHTVVLGSAVYNGAWLRDARNFVDRFAAGLLNRRVWLFSSGPVGAPPRPRDGAPFPTGMVERTQAVEHALFPGRLQLDVLSEVERALVRSVGAVPGDHRDWPAVDAWAHGIADALVPLAAARRHEGPLAV